MEIRQSDLANDLTRLAQDVTRLRSDVAFLSRVVQQFRDIAIAAHIAATNGSVELFSPPISELGPQV